MMMDEEIERTKEEIKVIEEACEKVETVLDRIAMGMKETKAIAEEGEHMQDVVLQSTTTAPAKNTGKWFENQDLMEIWKSTAAV
jgi:hypothetical protein